MASTGPKRPPGRSEPAFDLQSPDEQLVEIARAEALLHNRDPDQAAQVARAQLLHKGTEGQREQRTATIGAAAAKGERARRRRRIVAAIIVAGTGVAAVPLIRAMLRESERMEALHARVASLGRPIAALGFHEEKSWVDVPRTGVTFQVPPGTCSALMAAREGGDGALGLEIERESAPGLTTKGGVLWCSCEAEKITVKVSGEGDAWRGLAWMSAPLGVAGGAEVLAVRPADAFQLVADFAPQACVDAAFRAWAERGGHGDVDPLDPARPGPTADLVADGFEPAGLLAADRMFGVVRAKTGRCYLAAPEKGRSEIELRAADGTRLASKAGGAAAWCSHAADAIFSLWRADKASPPIVVLSAPADRAGGVMGAALAARRHGYRDVQSALLPDDLGRDARAALVAATVTPSSIVEADATGLPGREGDSVVAFAQQGKTGMLPEVSPSVPTACLPDPDPSQPLLAYLCAEQRPQVWHRGGDAQHQGAVEGARPGWLGVLGGESDEGALRAMAELLLFAQRMTLLGYGEPTTSDGVKDSPEGAVISGRPGKGDVVAVGISRTTPWLVPLGDGPAWKIAGVPRVVQIPAGSTKALRGEARLAANPKDRHVVVWRR